MGVAPAPPIGRTELPAALRPMHAGLAARDTVGFRMVCVGDSVQEGEGVTDPAFRYTERFEKMLRAGFPTAYAGSGVRGSVKSSFIPAYYLSSTLTDTTQDSTGNGSGTPTFTVDEAYGFGGRSLRLARGAALTWVQECTGFRIHYAKGSFGVNFLVLVDGVQVASVPTNDSTTAGGFITATYAVSPGVHTITVKTTDTSGFISTIHGAEFFYDDEVAGIRVYDAAKSGAHTNSFGAEHFKSITNIGAVQAVLISLVTNDSVLYSVSPSSFRTNLLARMAEIDTAITNEFSFIVLFVPQPNATLLAGTTWQQYIDAAKSACAARTNAYFVNMADFMGPSVAGDTLSLWADSVHMNRKGHAMCADALMRSLFLNGGGALEPDLGFVSIPAEAGNQSAAPAGRLNLYTRDTAGRTMLRGIDANGLDMAYQPHMGLNNVRMVVPNTGTTAATATSSLGTGFTNVASAISNPQPTTGSLKSSTKRVNFVTVSTAGTVTYHVQAAQDIWRGNAAKQGGFHFAMTFSLETIVSGNRAFFGLRNATAAPTNVDPTTSTSLAKIGLAINANTGNWQMVCGADTATPTVVDLGSTMPVNTTDVMRLHLFCPPNASKIGYRVENLTTGAVVSGSFSTNLPANNNFLAVAAWITNNATASPVSFNLHRWYCESDT